MGFHADRVDHRIGAAPLGGVADDVGDFAAGRVKVDGLDSEDLQSALCRDPAGHIADRAETQHGD